MCVYVYMCATKYLAKFIKIFIFLSLILMKEKTCAHSNKELSFINFHINPFLLVHYTRENVCTRVYACETGGQRLRNVKVVDGIHSYFDFALTSGIMRANLNNLIRRVFGNGPVTDLMEYWAYVPPFAFRSLSIGVRLRTYIIFKLDDGGISRADEKTNRMINIVAFLQVKFWIDKKIINI